LVMSSESNSQTVNDGESSVAMDFMPSQRTEANGQISSILLTQTMPQKHSSTSNLVKVVEGPVEMKSSLLGSSAGTP
jgi:hypothetical protein